MLLGEPVGALRDREVPLVLLDVRLDLVEAEIGGVLGLDRELDLRVDLCDLREHRLGLGPRCPDLRRLGDGGAVAARAATSCHERHREQRFSWFPITGPAPAAEKLRANALAHKRGNYQPTGHGSNDNVHFDTESQHPLSTANPHAIAGSRPGLARGR